jgi:ribosomal protein S18 acetylase RimI-like enzyme
MADAPAISPALEAARIALRTVVEADRPFLEALYRSVRREELAPTGWPEAAKAAFLAGQFDLQQRHYATAFAGAHFWIVTHDGEAIGRFYVDRTPGLSHVVEISLLPDWRGKGIGGALIAMLQDEAGPADRIVLHVDRTNLGAQRLYRRLGFAEAPATSPYPEPSIEMTWAPQTLG